MIDWPNEGFSLSLDCLRNTCDDDSKRLSKLKHEFAIGGCSPVPPFLHPFFNSSLFTSSEEKGKKSLQGRREGKIPVWYSCKGAKTKWGVEEKTMQKISRVQYLENVWASIRIKYAPCLNYAKINRFFWHSGVHRKKNRGRDRGWGWKIKTKSFFLT